MDTSCSTLNYTAYGSSIVSTVILVIISPYIYMAFAFGAAAGGYYFVYLVSSFLLIPVSIAVIPLVCPVNHTLAWVLLVLLVILFFSPAAYMIYLQQQINNSIQQERNNKSDS